MTQDAVPMSRDARERSAGTANLLATMDRTDFVRTLRRAQAKSPQSHDTKTLEMWAERLLPFLDREPGLTVAEALEHYHAGTSM
jgi:hypothetical protein